MTDEKIKPEILGWKFDAIVGIIKAQRRLAAQIQFLEREIKTIMGGDEHHDGFSDLIWCEDPVEEEIKKWLEVVK